MHQNIFTFNIYCLKSFANLFSAAAPNSELKNMISNCRSTAQTELPFVTSMNIENVEITSDDCGSNENSFIEMILHHESLLEFNLIKNRYLSNLSQQDLEFYKSKIEKNLTEIYELCSSTTEQTSALWLVERKLRITASNSYKLYTYASNKNPNWNKKLISIYDNKFKGNSSTKYGQYAEKCALNIYRRFRLIVRCGLAVSPQLPFLGASPDGIVFDGENWSLLEIKCPVKGKDLSIEQVLPTLKYLCIDEENYNLKTKHEYYGQIQLGLAITNLNICELMIFCTHDNSFKMIEVVRNELFLKKYIETLIDIYFTHALPYFIEKN